MVQLSSIPLRSGPRRQLSDENMKRAIIAVEGEGISVRQVSELYHVLRSTLYDRISGHAWH